MTTANVLVEPQVIEIKKRGYYDEDVCPSVDIFCWNTPDSTT
jgi:hypothetical protein